MLDRGGFSIMDDMTLIGIENGKLFVQKEHNLDISNLKYHREINGYN